MIISDAFKNDILSKNTQIIPLIIIEKSFYIPAIPQGAPESLSYHYTFLSTHNIEVETHSPMGLVPANVHFKPLLINTPNISQKVDMDKGVSQISSVTLDISNIDYNNSKRLSEKLESYGLINSIVCIYYKSQSCTKIQLPEHDFNGNIEDITDADVGCPRVFTGVIRNIKLSKDKITLSI